MGKGQIPWAKIPRMEDFLKLAREKFVTMDKSNEYDRELLRYALDLGLNRKMQLRDLCELVEVLAKCNPSLALSISAHHLALNCIENCEGFCAFALTEKSGSNVKDVKTSAEVEGGGYRIVGLKRFVTNGEFADRFVVSAKVEGKVMVFEVDGKVKAERINLNAFRGSGISKVYFDNMGERLGDLKLAMTSLNFGRVVFSHLALGIAKRCFEIALRRAKKMGLIENTGVRWRFVELKSEIEVLSGYLKGVVKDFNPKDFVRPAICKLKASEVAKSCSDFLVEVFGAKGLVTHSLPEILYRYAKALDMGEGTNEIMKEIVSRAL